MIKNFLVIGTIVLISSCSTTKNEVLVSDEITVAVPEVKVITPLQSINTNYLDKTIRPQDDFFLFSNVTWVKENPVPAYESRWGSFN